MKRILLTLLSLMLAGPALSDCVFREDTASQTFQIGPFLDSTDGITVEAGLTITNTDIRLSKEGGNFAAKNSGGGTYDEVGMYTITLDATDTNTAGNLQIVINETGAVPVWHECLVLASAYYDVLDATTSLMTSRQAGNMVETTVATAPTTTTVTLTAGASNDDAYNYGTVEFVGGTEECIKAITDYTGASKTVTYDSVCGFTVEAADTVRIHATASGKAVEDVDTRVAGLNNLSAAAVNAEVDTAITDADLDPYRVADTTIATLASQVSFTLTAGSADDDAYNGCGIIIKDATTAVQRAYAGIQDYAGATRTVTLDADPGIFTMAVSDEVDVVCLPVSVEFMNKSELLGDGSSGNLWRGN